ncbi:MAG TPA: hypothetical protein VK961_11615 [Chthoniobacter sp.]|nr:hypothetical protein [Chthoniobacter sp.]
MKQNNSRPLAAILLAAVILAGIAAWVQWRRVQARREAIAQREKATPAPALPQDGEAARALVNYLMRLRAQVRDHDAAFQRLSQEGALAWHIRDRVEIDRDRKVIEEFLATNARLTDTLQHAEGLIRAELETAKVSPTTRDAALALYAKTQAPLLPVQLRIRHCDEVIGKNGLAVLDLLDFNWGAWTRNEATQKLNFESTISLALFREYVGKIEEAANERKAAQDDLLRQQRRNATAAMGTPAPQ